MRIFAEEEVAPLPTTSCQSFFPLVVLFSITAVQKISLPLVLRILLIGGGVRAPINGNSMGGS